MNYKIINNDCLLALDELEEASIDSIVTDPPYELNFMGKGWDNSGIAFQKDTWQKCLRVLKPGGYLLAFGGSRTFHRIACAIEDAGFEIRDTIMWLYGSGFPKSMDISKQIDKRPNGGYTNLIKFGNYIKKARENKKMTKKELGKLLFDFDSNREDVPIQSWEIGKEIPKIEIWKKLKIILELNDDMDFIFEEAEREVIGEKIDPDGKPRSTRYKNVVSNPSAWNTLGTKEKIEKATYLTAPATDLAKQWQGWGTALKPSFEPIIVARKPFKGSLVDNVIENGVGGINIDECRVGTEVITQLQKDMTVYHGNNLGAGSNTKMTGITTQTIGRFPANTILTYDDTDKDEVCGGFPQSKGASSQNNYSNGHIYRGQSLQESNTSLNGYREWYNDSGSASRYFYCAKASRKDRDEGLDEFEQQKVNDGRKKDIDNAFQRGTTLRHNIHPTVKPTELMQYLVRLVTPKGGTILDPFMGSGSTGKAVMFENKERNAEYKFIGIEKEKEYSEIAEARIKFASEYKEEKEDVNQISFIDFIKGD